MVEVLSTILCLFVVVIYVLFSVHKVRLVLQVPPPVVVVR